MDSFVEANVATIKAAANVTAGQVLNMHVCRGSPCKISQTTVKAGEICNYVAKTARSTTTQFSALNPGLID
jgi:hypothetical protein